MPNKTVSPESTQTVPHKTAAYVIGHINIRDAEKWMEYRSRVSNTIAEWGGELVFRGRRQSVLSGEHPYTDTVVARFPDIVAVVGWYGSDAYQALIPLREQAAEIVLISYES